MKRFLWVIALLLLVAAPCTYAQGIPSIVAQANISFGPGEGGDNQFSEFVGPGVNLFATGDAGCALVVMNWCTGPGVYSNAPGTSLTPSIPNGLLDWVTVSGSVTFGGHTTHCLDVDCSLFSAGITALSSFVFPTNGQNFTVTVPAEISGPITGEVQTGEMFNLQIPPGELVLSFDFAPKFGLAPAYYIFSQGAFTTPMFPTPEPGPLGLLAAGLVGLLGVMLKRRKLPALSNTQSAIAQAVIPARRGL